MRRKFTVYGLRFSKTSFWNRINTGFLDPAVATVLTACGIETCYLESVSHICYIVATVLTACGIETKDFSNDDRVLPIVLQQCLPLAVLKRFLCHIFGSTINVATVLTACGIETN